MGAWTEEELRSKTVKDLKDLAKEVGAAVKASAKKDELIAALLSHEGGGVDVAGLENGGADAAAAGGAAGGDADAAADADADGKHSAIVFALEAGKKAEEPGAAHKANIQGIKVLSDAERAQLRAAKFGVAPQVGGSSKGGAGGPAGPVNKVGELEEQIKKLQRAEKYGTASDADKKKLEQLNRQLEAVQTQRRMALDKVELMDPDRMAEREKKFGKPLLTAAAARNLDPKDPEALRRRAEKFGKKTAPPGSSGGGEEDAARKKARLERFAAQK